jgi:hypothetical protein
MSSVSSIKDLRLVPTLSINDNTLILPPSKYTNASGESHWTIYVELVNSDDTPLKIIDEYYNGKPIQNAKALVYAEFGKIKTKQGVGAVTRTNPTIITVGKNIGKSNQTNVFTQALKDAVSTYNNHIKDKDTTSIPINEETIAKKLFGEIRPIDLAKLNAKSNRGPKPKKPTQDSSDDTESSLPVIEGTSYLPMLLNKLAIVELASTEKIEVKEINFNNVETLFRSIKDPVTITKKYKQITFNEPIYLQPKLDGLRCVACFYENNIKLYTRKLMDIPGHVHMKMQLISMYKFYNIIKLSDGTEIDFTKVYLDGELYHHRLPLNEINSIVKNSNNSDETDDKLEFHVFDCFAPNMLSLTFKQRNEILSMLKPSTFINTNINKDLVKIVPTVQIKSDNALIYYTTMIIKHGYEGSVVKYGSGPYEYGYGNKRSKYNLKVKQRFDSEYKIVGFTKGTKGNNAGAIIWIMETENGDQFKATPKYEEGTEDILGIRKKLYDELTANPDIFETEYKDKYATLEYEDISDKGIPQRVKFVAVRDDLP